jgi:hypothetical protein
MWLKIKWIFSLPYHPSSCPLPHYQWGKGFILAFWSPEVVASAEDFLDVCQLGGRDAAPTGWSGV